MRLVAHRDIPVDEVEELPRDLLGADDDHYALAGNARQHVLEALAVHGQMDLGPLPFVQDPPPGHARLDPEGSAEASYDPADRSLQARVPRRHEHRVRAERAGR